MRTRSRRFLTHVVLPLGPLLALACNEGIAPSSPEFLISDAVHGGGRPHFYFLPPMVRDPGATGTFDGGLSPNVEVCRMVDGACGAVVAAFDMTGSTGSEAIRVDAAAGHYIVNWHTGDADLDAAATYRVRILVSGLELGFADLDVVGSSRELRNVQTNEFVPLLDGRTLPIKFRIEQGLVARIEVSPAEAIIEVGQSQQYAAAVYDLHGGLLAVPVSWRASGAAASVDATGLATGTSAGIATIIADAAAVSGTAALTLEDGGAVALTFRIQPQSSVVFRRLGAVLVTAVDNNGDPVVDFTGDITISLGASPGGGSLSGTLTVAAVGGTASFTDLAIDLAGLGYALVASSAGLPDVTSDAFAIRAFTMVAAGLDHSCGLVTEAAAYCWGSNSQGQLGDGSVAVRSSPAAVSGGHAFLEVTPGGTFTCGLAVGGSAWCWGTDNVGQLGNGADPASRVPVRVHTTQLFERLSVGSFAAHTCGIVATGEAWCWGFNNAGRLGDGTATNQFVPVLVAGGSIRFTMIAAGGGHTCGIDNAMKLYCWGLNSRGQLGEGSFSSRILPTPVAPYLNWLVVSAGNVHTCGIATDGVTYCWGANHAGQLGDGSVTNRPIPTPVLGPGFQTVSAGGDHSCALDTEGTAWCWGSQFFGQLGLGSTGAAPVTVPSPGVGGLRSISAGLLSTCAMGLDGTAYCWGLNQDGRVGDGTLVTRNAPAAVVTP